MSCRPMKLSLALILHHYMLLNITIIADIASLHVAQHNNYSWFSEKTLIHKDDVHKHTKWYFQKGKQADNLITYL